MKHSRFLFATLLAGLSSLALAQSPWVGPPVVTQYVNIDNDTACVYSLGNYSLNPGFAKTIRAFDKSNRITANIAPNQTHLAPLFSSRPFTMVQIDEAGTIYYTEQPIPANEVNETLYAVTNYTQHRLDILPYNPCAQK